MPTRPIDLATFLEVSGVALWVIVFLVAVSLFTGIVTISGCP